MKVFVPPFYPIIDTHLNPHPLETVVAEFGRAGVRWVQLRDKQRSSRTFFEDSLRLLELAKSHGMSVIVNDRSDIAWLTEADGVHLGQEDLPVEEARRLLGPTRIIGCSTHNLAQAVAADRTTADYVAIGPVFATRSKASPEPTISWEELCEVRRQVKKPLVAIGGITTENALKLFELGVDSVSVISDILTASNRVKKVQEFLRLATVAAGRLN